jgi:glycosyltransferase involved in cell wall biosynthesis
LLIFWQIKEMAKPTCSLNISTYNWPAALKLCLQSVLSQKVHPDEVVIADDGSGPETKAIIDQFAAKSPFIVKHIWQEDKGYRLSEISNKAIAKSSCDYIIQVDGDCLLHPAFIADHLRFAKQNTFVCGTRSMINEDYTTELLGKGSLPFPLKTKGHLSKKYNAVYNGLLSALHYWFQRSRKNYLYVKGCNMAFWKNDLLKVNGYNEDFVGWGKEDNDLSLRLLNIGAGIRVAKFCAIQYHLHHNENNKSGINTVEALLRQTELKGLNYTPNGINKT